MADLSGLATISESPPSNESRIRLTKVGFSTEMVVFLTFILLNSASSTMLFTSSTLQSALMILRTGRLLRSGAIL